MIDLGALGGRFSQATAINDRGQIVGDLYTATKRLHAFLWQKGKTIDLGTLGGDQSQATEINDRGQIVGYSTTAVGRQHAFLWQSGKMTDLGELSGSVADSFNGVANEQFVPTGINSRGQIVGLAHDPIGSFEVGWLWQNGKLTTFGSFGGEAHEAVTINERGQVLVQTTPPSDKKGDAYLWQNGKLIKLPSFDDDTPATFASALNNQGQVVGESLIEVGSKRAFVWQNGKMTELATLTPKGTEPWDFAVAINDHDQIVGISNTAKHQHVVIWTLRDQ